MGQMFTVPVGSVNAAVREVVAVVIAAVKRFADRHDRAAVHHKGGSFREVCRELQKGTYSPGFELIRRFTVRKGESAAGVDPRLIDGIAV